VTEVVHTLPLIPRLPDAEVAEINVPFIVIKCSTIETVLGSTTKMLSLTENVLPMICRGDVNDVSFE
jgi:hypothetical protein